MIADLRKETSRSERPTIRVVGNWIRRLLQNRKPPLEGAPPVRRNKTYSGQSGYVYEYYYEGRREAARRGGAGSEYVFQVSSDRRTYEPVSVFVERGAVLAWERGRGRVLSATERYAVAKMALFQAFDERQSPRLMHEEVVVRPADLDAILERLGID
jgi:hypothetical protein